MLLKSKEPVAPVIAKLEDLLALKALSAQQRERIQEEIQNMRAGDRGERDAAYFIDFELGRSQNYAVLHDLRIEHGGRVAQIDHLIIGRMLDVILIESKNICTALRINAHGEFEVKTRHGWSGMLSPVEQNRRHAQVLGSLLETSGLLPRRLGVQITPEFHPWVLVASRCPISRACEKADIVKMDMFGARMKEWQEAPGDLWKMMKAISSETLRALGAALAAEHRPVSFDYAAKFGIAPFRANGSADARFAPPLRIAETPHPAKAIVKCCDACKAVVEGKVAAFCRVHFARFGGKLLCRACQVKAGAEVFCADCHAPVNSKVVAFCRLSSRRFEKKILCRDCQRSTVAAA